MTFVGRECKILDKSYIYNTMCNLFLLLYFSVTLFEALISNISMDSNLGLNFKLKHTSESGTFVSTELFSLLSSFQARWRNST